IWPMDVATASPTGRQLAFWDFVHTEVERQAEAGRLTLHQSHSLQAEVRERIAPLRQKLAKEAKPESVYKLETPSPKPKLKHAPAEEPAPKLSKPRVPVRNLLEILLDPRSIQ